MVFEVKDLVFGVAEGVELPSSHKRSGIRSFNAKRAKSRAKSPNMWTGLPRPHRETEKKPPPETEEKGVSKLSILFLSFSENDTNH